MSAADAPLPGFWRFVWMFFMQPITLRRLLGGVGVDPFSMVLGLSRGRRSSHEDWWLLRSAQAMLMFGPGTAVASEAILAAFGQHVNWVRTAYGVALGELIGLAGGAFVCIAFGLPVVIVAGLVVGAINHLYGDRGMTFSIAIICASVSLLRYWSDYSRALVPAGTLEQDRLYTVLFLLPLKFLDGSLRMPIFLIEAVIGTAARYWNAGTGRRTLHWAPVLYDELSYLPHPFLRATSLPRLTAIRPSPGEFWKRAPLLQGSGTPAAESRPNFVRGN